MPVEIIDAAGKLLQLKVRGMLKKADYDRIIQIAKEAIEPGGEGPCLHQFEGRERRGDWGYVSFMEQGQHIQYKSSPPFYKICRVDQIIVIIKER